MNQTLHFLALPPDLATPMRRQFCCLNKLRNLLYNQLCCLTKCCNRLCWPFATPLCLPNPSYVLIYCTYCAVSKDFFFLSVVANHRGCPRSVPVYSLVLRACTFSRDQQIGHADTKIRQSIGLLAAAHAREPSPSGSLWRHPKEARLLQFSLS